MGYVNVVVVFSLCVGISTWPRMKDFVGGTRSTCSIIMPNLWPESSAHVTT